MKPLALVVENDGSTRKLLGVLLGRFGLEVDAVAHGADALLLLEHVAYDVLFLDLLLPRTQGEDVLRWIETHRPELLPRCVVLSSAPIAQLERVRAEWPSVSIVRKPFELRDVTDLAQRLIAECGRRVETIAGQYCRRSVAAGAKASIVVRLCETEVALVTAFGYEPGVAESYFPLPIDAALPICTAIRKGAPVWLASVTLAAPEYPLLAAVWKENESRALAVVPLFRDGRIVGAAGWSFREPHLFAEPEQRALLEIAELATAFLPARHVAIA